MSDQILAGRPSEPGNRAMKVSRVEARRPRWRALFHRVAKSHYTHLTTGMLLVLTAVLEIVDGMLVESHHALLALGAVLVARSIVDIIEGMEYLEEASEEQGPGNP